MNTKIWEQNVSSALALLAKVPNVRRTAIRAARDAQVLSDGDDAWLAELQRQLRNHSLVCADTEDIVVQYLLGEPKQIAVMAALGHLFLVAQLDKTPDWHLWHQRNDPGSNVKSEGQEVQPYRPVPPALSRLRPELQNQQVYKPD